MSNGWPGSTACVVMLTFDMDGASGTLRRAPEMANRPSVLSQGDFGPKVGAGRILDLLASYDIPSSFFIPGWVAERHGPAVRAVLKAGHEVGHHGYLHEPPGTLASREEEALLLDKASGILERFTGGPVSGYRSPGWDISRWTLGLLAERGFSYDSSLMDDDQPYVIETESGRLVELPVHWSLDDAPYYSFNPAIGRTGPLLSPQIALETWTWEFDRVYADRGAFMLTMHPYLSGHYSRLEALDRLIKHIRTRPHVEFMRCVDMAKLKLRASRASTGSAARRSAGSAPRGLARPARTARPARSVRRADG